MLSDVLITQSSISLFHISEAREKQKKHNFLLHFDKKLL